MSKFRDRAELAFGLLALAAILYFVLPWLAGPPRHSSAVGSSDAVSDDEYIDALDSHNSPR